MTAKKNGARVISALLFASVLAPAVAATASRGLSSAPAQKTVTVLSLDLVPCPGCAIP